MTPGTSSRWDKLRPLLMELTDLAHAAGLMGWDQAVMMPPAGAPARARAMATLSGLYHDRLCAPEIRDALDALREDDSLDEETQASLRVLARDHERATKIPGDLVREIAETEGLAYQAWTEARPKDDFAHLEPHLTKMFALKKIEADALGWEGERYDALIDRFEPGMTTAELERIFTELTDGLKPIAERVLASSPPPPAFLERHFDPVRQREFCSWLVERLGFDLQSGRLDVSPHPFTIGIAAGDVRQTTKADPNDLMMSIFAVIHETGHALYEQGLPAHLADLPAGRVPSLGLHESQSRLWENIVARSRPFTDFLHPHLVERFPAELGDVTPDEWYAAVNHVGRSLIRVTADEVTYNLHVALRFELELALLRDELEVADLPDAFRAAMERHVGIRPADDADGVLQDMHWATGAIGYFPTYTLGTLYAAAFFDRAQSDLGELSDRFRAGDTGDLLAWLRKNIHSKAFLRPATELAHDVTGEPLSPGPFLAYLQAKYE